ncbi:hypothetical protein P3L10_018709 [Capsicum annuum]
MSHLKNALRLVGICLEFESPVMVYEYVEGIALSDLLYREGNHEDQTRKTLLSWEIDYRLPMRNIKPDKVMIDQSSGGAKIVDFSLSISLPLGKLEVEYVVCGKFCYIDPEYVISLLLKR